MRLMLTTILLLLPFQGLLAADPEWLPMVLKQVHPNDLAHYVDIDDACPFSIDKAESVVESVMVRSRIKPLSDAWVTNNLYLSAEVSCMNIEGNNPVWVNSRCKSTV